MLCPLHGLSECYQCQAFGHGSNMRYPVRRGMGYELIPGLNVPSSGELFRSVGGALVGTTVGQVAASPLAQSAASDAGIQAGALALKNWVVANPIPASIVFVVVMAFVFRRS
jgi:hypothetical protein